MKLTACRGRLRVCNVVNADPTTGSTIGSLFFARSPGTVQVPETRSRSDQRIASIARRR